ncbi:MAG: zinc-dependent alcohol dehydrogenase [Candidatus Helarchaeota archaeon]
MKGIYFKEPHNIEFKTDLSKPELKPDEVLVKVKYCGICGSDIESYETGALMLTGIILGHEFSGDVIEVGDKVKKIKIGTRVTANPNLPCGKCYWCIHDQENMCKDSYGLGLTHNGALAEYIKVKEDRLHKLPDNISYEEGAMVEPLAVATYAVQESGIKLGENAVVIGAGTIGLLTIQVLNAAGAGKIIVIEPVESKQKKALEVGADVVLNPKNWSKISKFTKKIGADHVFDCVAIPQTINNTMKIVKKGGHITFIGIHVEPFQVEGFLQLLLKNISIRGVFSYTNDTFTDTITLLEKRKINVKPLITKIIKLEEVPEMFKILSQLEHEEIKVLTKIQ